MGLLVEFFIVISVEIFDGIISWNILGLSVLIINGVLSLNYLCEISDIFQEVFVSDFYRASKCTFSWGYKLKLWKRIISYNFSGYSLKIFKGLTVEVFWSYHLKFLIRLSVGMSWGYHILIELLYWKFFFLGISWKFSRGYQLKYLSGY